MKLSNEILENLERPNYYLKVIDDYKDYYAINLNNVEFDNADVNNALQAIYTELEKSKIFEYLDDMADWNCCNKTPKFYNEMKKEYNYNIDIEHNQFHIRLKWNFDGEKYSTKSVAIYINFNKDTDLSSLNKKVEIIIQKTKEFLYNWHIIKSSLLTNMDNYIKRLIEKDKELNKERTDNVIKTEKEDTEFIDFCKNFKA